MGDRFLAAIARDPAAWPARRGAIHHRAATLFGFASLIDRDGLLLIAEPPKHATLDPARGSIIGTLFAAGASSPVTALPEASQALVTDTEAAHLVQDYWGRYVAILAGPASGSVHVLRAPLGELPCYYTVGPDTVIIASDISLLTSLGGARPSVNWDALARQLMVGDLRQTETCLTGITELQGGERLTVGPAGVSTARLWSPWTFAARRIDDRGEAIQRVRDSVRTCVAARASTFDHLVLKLSGGLDSSIVAAALAHSGRAFSCLTLTTDNPSGDERRYARLVADALSSPLSEVTRDVAHIDVMRSAAAHLPRPTSRSFLQESERAGRALAPSHGSTAIFDGGGGDNVFCALQSVAPAADCLLTDAPDARFWRLTREIARLAGVSGWTVAHRAMRRAWLRGPGFRWSVDRRLLSQDACAAMTKAAEHVWLTPPPGALPGKAAHVAMLAAGQSYVEALDPEAMIPMVAPLLAQPVVETCLGVPSWLWFEDGRNRVIARTAFAADLPDAVVWRRSKGSPGSFMAEIYETNRSALKALLLEGALAAHGLLDRAALERELDDPRPVCGTRYIRIMQLADAEAWARSWQA
ncbi:asparagine synthase [Sphingomonas sp. So64.6b]|uniref:asparagine synthase-related protein n=1 Tax=Sphingomonas sp. So64.6b TaxID=2997354 RepID=UPI001603CE88|nr:asparagine synthase C-terminal domain-containing protein [Sphingomonas sp. So64.6b]QNA83753.1 asparagine synthase [Sphingomonas sp. So64.6b]